MIVLYDGIKIIKLLIMTGSVSDFLVKHFNVSPLPGVLHHAGRVQLCLQHFLTETIVILAAKPLHHNLNLEANGDHVIQKEQTTYLAFC